MNTDKIDKPEIIAERTRHLELQVNKFNNPAKPYKPVNSRPRNNKTIINAYARTVDTNPIDATPANRPAGIVGQIVYYSGNLFYCSDAATPLWKQIEVVAPAG